MKTFMPAWAWRDALFLAKKGQPDKLAVLLREEETPVPAEVRAFLADAVDGTTKLPARNTRIKCKHETKLVLYKLAGALAQYESLGVYSKDQVKRMEKKFLQQLATETGANPVVLKRFFNEYRKPQAASWRSSVAAAKKAKTEYVRIIVRDGKKVKVES
jgi:MoxR-like ATPase